jgi:hypothetical protein
MKRMHQALAQALQSGIYSQNEARVALGLNPKPNGDQYLVNSALIPVADAGRSKTLAQQGLPANYGQGSALPTRSRLRDMPR